MLARDTALVATLAVSLLAACSAGSQYHPHALGGLVGYSDMRLSPIRYRVSFSGSSGSTQNQVQVYLLWRAAEITLQAGFTHFVFDRSETRRNERYSYVYGGPPIYYAPSSSYWPGSASPVISYSADAEIVLLTPEDAACNPDATDALSILQLQVPPWGYR
jgi:hypothetical protein